MRGNLLSGIIIGELVVAHAALVGEEEELWVALLAVVADATRSWGVGGEVFLGAVVRVNVDLHERILHHRLLHALVKALVHAKFEQRLQQLAGVAL